VLVLLLPAWCCWVLGGSPSPSSRVGHNDLDHRGSVTLTVERHREDTAAVEPCEHMVREHRAVRWTRRHPVELHAPMRMVWPVIVATSPSYRFGAHLPAP
jgi:hypothetical protein